MSTGALTKWILPAPDRSLKQSITGNCEILCFMDLTKCFLPAPAHTVNFATEASDALIRSSVRRCMLVPIFPALT